MKKELDLLYYQRMQRLEVAARNCLDLEFFDQSSAYQTFVGSRFIWTDRMHEEGDLVGRNMELLKLELLFKNLEEVRSADPQVFTRVRRAINKSKSESAFFGARMEVFFAASLIRSGCKIRSQESPDYALLDTLEGLYVESASAHITTSNTDIIQKIRHVVRNKTRKPYADRQPLLMMDITNLLFVVAQARKPVSRQAFDKAVLVELLDSGLGAALLFSYGFDDHISTIRASYMRVDSPTPDKKLVSFLDKHYPEGSVPLPAFVSNQS